jgi:hypothetical protein
MQELGVRSDCPRQRAAEEKTSGVATLSMPSCIARLPGLSLIAGRRAALPSASASLAKATEFLLVASRLDTKRGHQHNTDHGPKCGAAHVSQR